jgi:hypothetical protein
MTRFHQKFDLVPKKSLRGQLGRLNMIEKHNVLTIVSWKRKLYLNTFHPFFWVSIYRPRSRLL